MNPDILLVEDDPTSCAYLLALTRTLPARVDGAGSAAEALRLSAQRRYDLWLIDANLPDSTGTELLHTLRRDWPATPALAHTAAHERSELDPLIAAGFSEVLVKPVDAPAWLGAIRRALGLAVSDRETESREVATNKRPVWDDATAAQALGGNMDNVAALRALFLGELPMQVHAVREGSGAARREQLHRLRASCGFVGASRLQDAAARLQEEGDSPAALQAFVDIAQDTIAQAR